MWQKGIFLERKNQCLKNGLKCRMIGRILYLTFSTSRLYYLIWLVTCLAWHGYSTQIQAPRAKKLELVHPSRRFRIASGHLMRGRGWVGWWEEGMTGIPSVSRYPIAPPDTPPLCVNSNFKRHHRAAASQVLSPAPPIFLPPLITKSSSSLSWWWWWWWWIITFQDQQSTSADLW